MKLNLLPLHYRQLSGQHVVELQIWRPEQSDAGITFIGAGSLVFTCNLCSDILLTPALQNATITLVGIVKFPVNPRSWGYVCHTLRMKTDITGP